MTKKSNALERVNMEYDQQLAEIRKLKRELKDACWIISSLCNEYGLREDNDDKPLLPWDKQPSNIQSGIQFTIEICGN